MSSLIETFSNSIKLDGCRIKNTPNFLFLCGGKTQPDEIAYSSARDGFFKFLKEHHSDLHNRVLLAESVNDWFDHDIFPDLLDLEEHIASLCDRIVLFVESPGSIAELGAFSTSDKLRPKTLAVMNNGHSSRSFIKDGPIRKLERAQRSQVQYFDWKMDAPHQPAREERDDDLTDMSRELVHAIRTSRAVREAKLDMSNHGHCMFLLADFVDIFGAVTLSDMHGAFTTIAGSSQSRKQIQKYAWLMEKLGMVSPWRRGDEKYLVAKRSGYLTWGFKPDSSIRDILRFKAAIRESYDHSSPRAIAIRKSYSTSFSG